MANLVDVRGFDLVPQIYNDDKMYRGVMDLVAGRQRAKAEDQAAQDEFTQRETLRQGGVLAQYARQGDEQSAYAMLDAAIQQEQNPVTKQELMELRAMPYATGKNVAMYALRGNPLTQNMLPDATRGLGINSRNLGYVQDDKGNVFTHWATSDPNTGTSESSYEPLNPKVPNPIGGVTPVSTESLNLRKKLETTESFEQETAEDRAKREAMIAGKTAESAETAKANVQLQTAYDIAMAEARAKAQQTSIQQAEEAKLGIQQLTPLFALADEALADPAGIYAGDVWDKIQGGLLPKVGFVVNQDRLNNTAKFRMAMTQVKTGAKPVGSGNPTEGEWAMYAQTIPDPETSNIGALKAGYNAYKKLVDAKYRELERIGQRTPLSSGSQQAPQQQTQQPQVIDWSSY